MFSQEEFLPGESAEYGHEQLVRISLDDLDGLGIVHNARYALLFERALISYWLDRGWHFDPNRSIIPDVLQVVGEFGIRYRSPITAIGDVAVRFWIDRAEGARSTYAFQFLSLDRQTVYAEGHRVQIRLDPATLRPTPYSDEVMAMARVLMRPRSAAASENEPTTPRGLR